MHTAPTRDEYVGIKWDNIIPELFENFRLIDYSLVTMYDFQYDYMSVMHYSRRAFSKNGEPTIIPLKNPKIKIGQRKFISKGDVARIRKMYCSEYEFKLDGSLKEEISD
jgi:hypothetical protein